MKAIVILSRVAVIALALSVALSACAPAWTQESGINDVPLDRSSCTAPFEPWASWVCEVRLKDGTRCAVTTAGAELTGIDCDWSGASE